MAKRSEKEIPQVVLLPVGDFARALDIADKFNVRSGARPGLRVRKVVGQALSFMQGVTPQLAAGSAITAGSQHGMDPFLDKDLAREIAREKDKVAYLSGNTAVELSQTSHATIMDMRKAFKFSSNAQAATLAVRVYQKLLDHFWRGNNVSMTDKDSKDVPFEIEHIREQAIGARSP